MVNPGHHTPPGQLVEAGNHMTPPVPVKYIDHRLIVNKYRSSNGSISRVAGLFWGVSTGHWSQRPMTRSFDVFLERRPNKRLSKQSIRRWFETPSRSLWCYCYCHFDSSSLISRWLTMKWNRWEKWIKIYGLFSCPSELNNDFAFWVLNLIGTIWQTYF